MASASSTTAGASRKPCRYSPFTSIRRAPGEYRMYPLEQNEEDAYLDGEYLRKFDKRSIPVSVGPGTTLAVTVELP